MGQDPAAIRQEIEETRERMGETVDALGYKADVPARAKESISGTVQNVRDKIYGTGSQIQGAAPGGEDVKQAGRRAVGVAQENPLGLTIAAAAVGFLAGMLIPSTDVENERLGPMSDQVKSQAIQTGQVALEHGKQVAGETMDIATQKAQEVAAQVKESAQDAASDVKDSVQVSAQQHGEDLAATARENAQEAQQGAAPHATDATR